MSLNIRGGGPVQRGRAGDPVQDFNLNKIKKIRKNIKTEVYVQD